MGRRIMTQEIVDRLLESFAADPGCFSRASRIAGVSHRTAKRAWTLGWPDLGIPPMSETIAEQQAAARALAERKAVAEVEAARDAKKELRVDAALNAARDREREGQIARAARDNALALQAISMNLAKKGHNIVQNLSDKELNKLSAPQKLKALKTMAEFNEKAATVADKAITLHRLIMGEPTGHVAHTHNHSHAHAHVAVPPDQMVSVIARAQKAVESARKRGILNVKAIDKKTGT